MVVVFYQLLSIIGPINWFIRTAHAKFLSRIFEDIKDKYPNSPGILRSENRKEFHEPIIGTTYF